MTDLIVGLLAIIIVSSVIAKAIIDKKKGKEKNGCSGCCSSCSSCHFDFNK